MSVFVKVCESSSFHLLELEDSQEKWSSVDPLMLNIHK